MAWCRRDSTLSGLGSEAGFCEQIMNYRAAHLIGNFHAKQATDNFPRAVIWVILLQS